MNEEKLNEEQQIANDFDGHLETGFQLATAQGPLCAEPVEGLAYFIESLEIDYTALEEERGTFSLLDFFIVVFVTQSLYSTKQGSPGHWIIHFSRP